MKKFRFRTIILFPLLVIIFNQALAFDANKEANQSSCVAGKCKAGFSVAGS